MADEGIPVGAIARAVKISSSELRYTLRAAVDAGRLTEIPTSDWPPGFPRDQRSLQLSRMVSQNREALCLLVRQLFGLKPSEGRALLKLIESENVSREVLHLAVSHSSDPVSDIGVVDVVLCTLRKKLRKFGIEVVTLWGYGYKLTAKSRHLVIDLVTPIG